MMQQFTIYEIVEKVWSAGGGGGGPSACGSSGMDALKHEVAYRGLPSQVKAEPGVSHNGHQVNGHVREWMAGGAGAGSPSPGAPAQPQPNGYSSPLSSSSYGPYSPNGKIGKLQNVTQLKLKLSTKVYHTGNVISIIDYKIAAVG